MASPKAFYVDKPYHTHVMDDPVDADFFEQALKAEGLSNVEVLQYREPADMCEVIRVRSEVGGERVGMDHRISEREVMEIDDMHQHMATLAAQTARQFDEYLTEQVEWGEKSVRLDLKQDYEATCFRCGAEVSLDDLRTTAPRMAESAHPHPQVTDPRNLPQPKIRMTLLALLRGECDGMCPNSPDSTYRKI